MAADHDELMSGQVTVRTIDQGQLVATSDRLDEEAWRAAATSTLSWIDLVDPSDASLRSMEAICGLHPRVVNKIIASHRASDASFFDGTTHIVLHYPQLREDESLEVREMQAILGERFLITVHEPGTLDIADVLDHWRDAPDAWRSTTGALLYAIFRMVMTAFMAAADSFDASLKRLHDEVVTQENVTMPRRQLLSMVFTVSEQIAGLHQMAGPALSIMQRLERNDEWFAHEDGTMYSRDVIDEAARLVNRLGLMGDSAGRLLDSIYALITLRSTDMSNRLTIVATIFLPLSFLSSYFGQNFQYVTDQVSSGGHFLVWGVATPILSLSVILVLLWRFGAFD